MALKQTLSKTKIYAKIPDEEIFKRYFGEFDTNKSYHSPFREDKRPSTGFFVAGNRLLFGDFTTGEKLDAIDFVAKLKEKEGIVLKGQKLLTFVMNEFGFESMDDLAAATEVSTTVIAQRKEKKDKIITFDFDKWNEDNLKYWKDYYITEQELIAAKVYPVKNTYVNRFQLPPIECHRYAYLIPYEKDIYTKVYAPLCPEFKWLGNVPLTVPFGLDALPFKSDTLIITKGNKDLMIFRKYFTDVIALQNETVAALPDWLVAFIKAHYKRVIVNFDVDKQWVQNKETKEFEWRFLGKEFTSYCRETYGWDYVNVPNKFFNEEGIKDFSDMVKVKGLPMFEQYLKWKKLL